MEEYVGVHAVETLNRSAPVAFLKLGAAKKSNEAKNPWHSCGSRNYSLSKNV
jgi:hypothetical protein